MPLIKTSDLYNKIVEVANKNPDVLYRDRVKEITGDRSFGESNRLCFYQVNSQPACIVGVALHELGFSIRKLEKLDDNYGCIDTALRLENTWFELDGRQEEIARIQMEQDEGHSWSEAVQRTLDETIC